MSTEFRQTLIMIMWSGLYSGVCIIAAMICGAFFQSNETTSWLNVFFFIGAIATLEYYLIVQGMLCTIIMIIIHEPHLYFLGGFLLIVVGLLLLAGEELHKMKHAKVSVAQTPEFIPMDAPKFGVLLFMAIVVALMNDSEIWIGLQLIGFVFVNICAFAAAEKIDSSHS